jgi:hypothetical protein
MLDTVGFLARSVTDLETIFAVYNTLLDIPPPIAPPRTLRECHFLFVKTQAWAISTPSPELKRAWIQAI